MVNFEEKMRESSQLFREEQRIIDISQRLAEQTEYVHVVISRAPRLMMSAVYCFSYWST